MAGTLLGEAYIKVKVDDLRNLERQIDSAGRKFNSETQKMGFKAEALSRSFAAIGSAIASIGIYKFGQDIISAATRMDSLNRALVVAEGSAEKASQRMKQFIELAKAPGLGMPELAKGYIQLKAVGIEADLATRSIKAIANAIALVGGGKEDLEGVIRQFVQMQGKGKVMAEDLMIIAERFPQVRKLAEQAFGTANTEMLQKMGITGKQFIEAITKEAEKLPKAMESAKNAQDNFNDAMERFKAILGTALLPALTNFLNKITSLIEKFEALPASTQKMMGTAVVGGVGLLGLLTTLGAIANTLSILKTGLAGLGVSEIAGGIGKGGAGIGAVLAGGLSKGMITIGTATITATSVIWAGQEIYRALTRDFTQEERAKWAREAEKHKTEALTPETLRRYEAMVRENQFQEQMAKSKLKQTIGQNLQLPDVKNVEVKSESIKYVGRYEEPVGLERIYGNLKERPLIPYERTGEMTLKPSLPVPEMKIDFGKLAKDYENILEIEKRSELEASLIAYANEQANKEAERAVELSYKKWLQEQENELNAITAKQELAKLLEQEHELQMQNINAVMQEWQSFTDDMKSSIQDVSYGWQEFSNKMQSSLNTFGDVFYTLEPIFQKLGMSEGTSRKISGTVSGATTGAMTGATIGTMIAPGIGTAIGAILGGLAGGYAGYLRAEGYQEGGWIAKPTIALMGEREPELVIPKSKMEMFSGFGKINIENINITQSDPDVKTLEAKIYEALCNLTRSGRINKAVFA